MRHPNQEEVQVGDRVKITDINPNDAFGFGPKHIVGKKGIIQRVSYGRGLPKGMQGEGYASHTILVDGEPHVFVFYAVKVKKIKK
jgi:hypothetical protein